MEISWKGIYPAVTTKFTPDYQLDIPGFQKNIQAQMDAGVHGVVLGGTLGEASVLSSEEKIQLVASTREVTQNTIPVIVNIAEQVTANAIAEVRKFEALGADGFMLLPPMRYAADSHETVTYLKTVARATERPVMLYNNPVDYKTLITLDMFDQLAEIENIQAVKESTRDVTNVTRMINRFGDRFSVLCGVDTIAMESLVMGARGWVAGLVCAFPVETVSIYQLVESGQIREARDLFRWFLPVLELDIHPKLVQYIKLAESMTGLGTELVRPPRLQLNEEERITVSEIIRNAIDNRPQIQNLFT